MLKDIHLRYERGKQWLRFNDPLQVIATDEPGEIVEKLKLVEDKVKSGHFAAGFVSYEAASGLDASLVTHAGSGFPLLCFGIFKAAVVTEHCTLEAGPLAPLEWAQETGREQYEKAIDRIKDYIAAGDTYQVNYTLRQLAHFSGESQALFKSMSPNAPYAAYVDAETFSICSASPELFFDLKEGQILVKPMKGTAARGKTIDEDNMQKSMLEKSLKDRAENIMIVDMIRNDLSKIAHTGTVRVEKKFEIEKYPTVWQMTSTVTAKNNSSIPELFSALFPCASITGAPKVNTMRIIRQLEGMPRNIYTGCIGFFAPDGRAQFNVAIRTALIDKKRKEIEYGIGGGIVWDSEVEAEYRECMLKAKVMNSNQTSFDLLESLRWEPSSGYFLLDEHLDRLCGSAKYFDFDVDMEVVKQAINLFASNLDVAAKVRLLLARNGEIGISSQALPPQKLPTRRLRFARSPIDSDDTFIYHKTTRRETYEAAMLEHCDDVILWNEKSEITESTIANIVIKRNGQYVTPPQSCGLLNGTFRQHLLMLGEIREAVITRDEVMAADELYLINSVRKWMRAELIDTH